MNDPARILKADHREVEKLLAKLADSEEGADRNALVEETVTKLNLHMQLEESLVYPQTGKLVGEEDQEEAEIEHSLARDTLGKMESMAEAPGFGAVVAMLQAGLAHHIEEEESQLLPELKDAMERAEWNALGDALADAKEAAGMPVPAAPARRSSKRTSSSKSTKRASNAKR